MPNKIINEQLRKIETADLTHFNPETNTYTIPKKQEIKLEEDCCYILHLKQKAFLNDVIAINWNNGSTPKAEYYKADIAKKMSGMVKILGISHDPITETDLNDFWTGWLSIKDIEVIKKL